MEFWMVNPFEELAQAIILQAVKDYPAMTRPSATARAILPFPLVWRPANLDPVLTAG